MTVHAKPLEADMRLMNAEVGDGGAPLKKRVFMGHIDPYG